MYMYMYVYGVLYKYLRLSPAGPLDAREAETSVSGARKKTKNAANKKTRENQKARHHDSSIEPQEIK